ncbi:DUF5691 domain-containing protein [Sphingomonas sp. CLY1604]|uniref:DUF5691 domain-containing protein n=1 Tax=Sphingomonas sp. CLY1604 TaxID=3457786 RepID=UPI003FD8CA6B
MADAILDALGPVLTRWTMGGSAAAHAPAAWCAVLGTDAREAELRLLALSGHFLGTLATTQPTGDARPRGDIPALARPPLADALRPRARRLLPQMRDAQMRRHLLDLVDARGWTLHPGDWMPRPDEDVPDIYAPWQDWAASGSPSVAPEALSATNWDDFAPAARHVAFAALRRRDPVQASQLMAERIAGEPADRRVRLLELLAAGLSDADRPLLERLAGDRAPRVRQLATALLARLGHGTHDDEHGAELAAFFTIQTRGLLRRTRVIVAQAVKTAAQRHRRDTLFQTPSFDGFAQALGLAPTELVAAWRWGEDMAGDQQLAAMAARSASDAIVETLADAPSTGHAHTLIALLPRLSPRRRHQAATRLLGAQDARFAMVLAIAGGAGGIDDAIRTPAGTALVDALKADNQGAGDHADELLALGLIASRSAARQALDQLAAAGLIASDPRLDMLRLNAALDNRRPTE